MLRPHNSGVAFNNNIVFCYQCYNDKKEVNKILICCFYCMLYVVCCMLCVVCCVLYVVCCMLFLFFLYIVFLYVICCMLTIYNNYTLVYIYHYKLVCIHSIVSASSLYPNLVQHYK